jgi:hypothetical protein
MPDESGIQPPCGAPVVQLKYVAVGAQLKIWAPGVNWAASHGVPANAAVPSVVVFGMLIVVNALHPKNAPFPMEATDEPM